jgi:dihydrofolate reductase
MPELLIDFITSLDGYAAAEGWPGWWGLQGPEYLAWLGQSPEADYTVLMGATTYRVISRSRGGCPVAARSRRCHSPRRP